MEAVVYQIGEWRFDPSDPVLRGSSGERRLEDRAASTLAELCRRRGEVVSKAELLAQIWAGRVVSDNSVSIVIGNLRRALGDDPREPALLLTVARRGYRLVPEPGAAQPAQVALSPQARRGRVSRFVGALSSAAVIAAVGLLLPWQRPILIRVEAPVNDTGRPELTALTRSLAPVVVDGVRRLPGASILEGAGDGSRVAVRSRLLLWNGAPELALSAVDVRSRTVIWTGFAAGPPSALARHVTDRLRDLAPNLPKE